MTTEKKHGGSRANSGRKLKHGEKTVLVRIPASWQNDLTRCLFEGINPFEFVQNQDAEKDRLISELSAKLETVQNQVEKVQNQDDRIKPIEPSRQSTAKPPRQVDSEMKKVVLQQANVLRAENVKLSENDRLSERAIARLLSDKFNVKLGTVRYWLKKE